MNAVAARMAIIPIVTSAIFTRRLFAVLESKEEPLARFPDLFVLSSVGLASFMDWTSC
jgi:hypothetical protein